MHSWAGQAIEIVSLYVCINMYIYIYIYIYLFIYLYIERERPFFIPIRNVDNNRGGGAGNCYKPPPCKQRGGGKAGTRVGKYKK